MRLEGNFTSAVATALPAPQEAEDLKVSLEELMERTRNGNRPASTELYKRLNAYALTVLVRNFGSIPFQERPEIIAFAVSQTALSFDPLKGVSVTALLTRILRNAARDFIKGVRIDALRSMYVQHIYLDAAPKGGSDEGGKSTNHNFVSGDVNDPAEVVDGRIFEDFLGTALEIQGRRVDSDRRGIVLSDMIDRPLGERSNTEEVREGEVSKQRIGQVRNRLQSDIGRALVSSEFLKAHGLNKKWLTICMLFPEIVDSMALSEAEDVGEVKVKIDQIVECFQCCGIFPQADGSVVVNEMKSAKFNTTLFKIGTDYVFGYEFLKSKKSKNVVAFLAKKMTSEKLILEKAELKGEKISGMLRLSEAEVVYWLQQPQNLAAIWDLLEIEKDESGHLLISNTNVEAFSASRWFKVGKNKPRTGMTPEHLLRLPLGDSIGIRKICEMVFGKDACLFTPQTEVREKWIGCKLRRRENRERLQAAGVSFEGGICRVNAYIEYLRKVKISTGNNEVNLETLVLLVYPFLNHESIRNILQLAYPDMEVVTEQKPSRSVYETKDYNAEVIKAALASDENRAVLMRYVTINDTGEHVLAHRKAMHILKEDIDSGYGRNKVASVLKWLGLQRNEAGINALLKIAIKQQNQEEKNY